MIILEIPAATPSLNEFYHKHWIFSFRQKKRWKKLVRDAIYEAQAFPLPESPPSFATVKVERFGKKLPDLDNGFAGLKFCVDALKEFRLIADDSPAHILLEFKSYIHKLPHSRITITPRL